MHPYARQIIIEASGIKDTGKNPSYTYEEFIKIYPQFTTVPKEYVQSQINRANSSLPIDQYGDSWNYCMGLFVAHFCFLWLKTTAGLDENSATGAIIAKGGAKGIATSKSAGDVSISYDVNSSTQGIEDWGTWKDSEFGRAFATEARLMGKCGMMVW